MLPETADYNARVTSNDDWSGFQVVALSFSSADDIDNMLGRANLTDIWRIDRISRTAHVVVSTNEAQYLQKLPGVSITVTIGDLGVATKATMPAPNATRWDPSRPMVEFFEEWRNLEEIELFSKTLCALHKNFVGTLFETVCAPYKKSRLHLD